MIGTFVDATLEAGVQTYELSNANLEAGVYFYQIRAGKSVVTKKMVIVR